MIRVILAFLVLTIALFFLFKPKVAKQVFTKRNILGFLKILLVGGISASILFVLYQVM